MGNKKKNLLKIIVRMGPLGLEYPADVYITDRNVPKQKLYDLSRGEGNVLCFTLTHSDLSTNFASALESGQVAKELSGGVHKLHWDLGGMRTEDEEDDKAACPRCEESVGQHFPGCPQAPPHYKAEWEKREDRYWPEEQFLMWERQLEKLGG